MNTERKINSNVNVETLPTHFLADEHGISAFRSPSDHDFSHVTDDDLENYNLGEESEDWKC